MNKAVTKETVLKLSTEARSSITVSTSDLEVANEIKGDMPHWLLFRKALAAYIVAQKEANAA